MVFSSGGTGGGSSFIIPGLFFRMVGYAISDDSGKMEGCDTGELVFMTIYYTTAYSKRVPAAV